MTAKQYKALCRGHKILVTLPPNLPTDENINSTILPICNSITNAMYELNHTIITVDSGVNGYKDQITAASWCWLPEWIQPAVFFEEL